MCNLSQISILQLTILTHSNKIVIPKVPYIELFIFAAKILFNINKSSITIDKELFKQLVGIEIWEFRTLYRGSSYRILAFWDTTIDALVVTTHAFVKKEQKTPIKEIRKAEMIRDEYFKTKK